MTELCSACTLHCEYIQNTTAITNAEASHTDTQAVITGLFQPKRSAKDMKALESVRKQIADAHRAEKKVAKGRHCPHVA